MNMGIFLGGGHSPVFTYQRIYKANLIRTTIYASCALVIKQGNPPSGNPRQGSLPPHRPMSASQRR